MAPEADTRLRRLEDAEAIRTLIARYGPLADAGNAEALALLWHEAGEYEVAGFGVARGHAEIAALIDGAFHLVLMAQGCAHILSPPVIALDGDRASALNHSMVLRQIDETWEVWRVSANRWEFIRTSAGWRVARRVNRPLDGNADAVALFVGA